MFEVLLLVLVTVPSAVASLALLRSRRGPSAVGAAATWSAGVLFALTAVLAVVVVRHGPVEVVAGDRGAAWIGLHADRLAVLLLALVLGVSALAQAFAGRYLSGDPRRAWFVAATGVLTSGSAVLVTAATLLTVAVAWTAAGIGLWLLLRTYPHLPAARDGAARALRAFAVGDAALWIAVVVATLRWGAVDLRQGAVAAAAGDRGWAAVVTGLLVVAALTRSAQVPWHRWLPATLAAPTPVSALLHAGVVNAGGVLLVRLDPVTQHAPGVMVAAVAAGAVTLVYGTAVMLVRPDVKGALAYSTMGQMGFMIMTAGLGWYAVTIFHIVAHGLYKAALFLGSGSAVHRHARDASAGRAVAVPRRRRLVLAGAAALLIAGTVAAAEAWRPYPGGRLLAVFVWASATALCWGWLRRQATVTAALGMVAAVAAGTCAYIAAVHAVTGFLALPVRATPIAGAVVAAVVAASAGIGVLRRRGGAGLLGEWHRTLYVTLLAADRRSRPPRRRPGVSGPVRTPAAVEPIAVGAPS
jgi:NADH:ubiquinone oxidoreductase subunit 5 (subunit L)/multisubunit Na+/H+ antiporter MnhA subunit